MTISLRYRETDWSVLTSIRVQTKPLNHINIYYVNKNAVLKALKIPILNLDHLQLTEKVNKVSGFTTTSCFSITCAWPFSYRLKAFEDLGFL